MDWKIITATFTVVFIAELADKTQMVGISMSAKSGKPLAVWAGSVLAYAVVTILSVLLGAVLSKYLKPELIRYTGALLFIAIGVMMLFGKI